MGSKTTRTVYTNLHELITFWDEGEYKRPSWQRDNVNKSWDDKKIASYKKGVREKIALGCAENMPSTIVLCTIGKNSQLYVNDGCHRLDCLSSLKKELKKELGEKEARKALARIVCPLAEIAYDTEKEAREEYIKINLGTPLLPSEIAKTLLTDLTPFEQYWQVLQKVVFTVEALERALVTTPKSSRVRKDLKTRESYALLLRYLTEDTQLEPYKMDIREILDEDNEIVERRLVTYIKENDLNIAAFSDKVEEFIKFLTDETTYIRQVWDTFRKEQKWDSLIQKPTQSFFRYLCHLGVYRRNTGVTIKKYTEFLTELFRISKGKTSIFWSASANVSTRNLLLHQSDLRSLRILQKNLGVELLTLPKRKRRSNAQLDPGTDISHVLPFSENGEGPVVPESLRTNRSRGAEPIQ